MILRETFFAARPLPPWINWIMLAAAIFAAAIGALFVALALRKRPKRKRKHHRHNGLKTHNPTLAETGGLPPRRDEQDSQTPKP